MSCELTTYERMRRVYEHEEPRNVSFADYCRVMERVRYYGPY